LNYRRASAISADVEGNIYTSIRDWGLRRNTHTGTYMLPVGETEWIFMGQLGAIWPHPTTNWLDTDAHSYTHIYRYTNTHE